MEDRDLVERRDDPNDNRSTRVYLTELGRSKYAQAWPDAYRIIQNAFGVLSEAEREALETSLKRVADHVCRF